MTFWKPADLNLL